MNYVLGFVVVIASICYGTSCFFVMTTSDEEVKNYCYQPIMDKELRYSQRNVACRLQRSRK